MSNTDLQTLIEAAWERRTELSPGSDRKVADAVDEVLAGLDSGALRVAEKAGGDWVVHQWVKKAVLLSFRLQDNVVMDAGAMKFYDKVDSKFAGYDAKAFADGGFRVVPAATPGAIIARLNEETRKALQAPALLDILERQGIEVQYSTAAEFGRLMSDDRQRWSRLVKEAGVVLR